MSSIASRPTLTRLASSAAYRQAPMLVAYASVTIVVLTGLHVLLWLWQVKGLGVTINWTGELLSVQPDTMVAGASLQPGDYVTFDDFQRLKRFSADAAVGQLVEVAVHQDGEWRYTTLQAIPNSPQRLLSLSVEPFVGIMFAIFGLAPLVARRRGFSLWLFLIGLELTALFFITDIPRAYHQFWGELVAYATFPLFPAVAFHFHTVFPQERLGPLRRRAVLLVYLMAAAILPFNLMSISDYAFHVSDRWQWTLSLYQGALLAACAGLVIRTFATTRDRKVRAQLKIITACLAIGLLVPAVVVVLIMMFDLDTSEIVKSGTIFIGLIVPAGYAYSMVRHKLLVGDLLWRPSLMRVIYTSVLSLGLVAFAVYIFPGKLALAGSSSFIAWSALVLLAIALAGLHERLGRWTEKHFFKGGSYVDLLASATDELTRFHQLEEYVSFFTTAFPTRLRSVGSLVFLAEVPGGPGGPLSLRGHSPGLRPRVAEEDALVMEPDGELGRLLGGEGGPVALTTLILPHAPELSVPDARLLDILRAARVEWLLPLVSSRQPQLVGVVALGAKETDEPYSPQEVTALTALARTASIAAENVLMFEALQNRVRELDQEREFSSALARDLSVAREKERSRISDDIHDTVLQDLGVALRLLATLRYQLQQALGVLEDAELALEGPGAPSPTGGPQVEGAENDWKRDDLTRSRAETQELLHQCQAMLGSLLGEFPTGFGIWERDPAGGSALSAPQPSPRHAQVSGEAGLIEGILSLARSTHERLREICINLHPAYLDAPLVKTLSHTLKRLDQVSPGVNIEIRVCGEEPTGLGSHVKYLCKKIAEQAVHNALEHARPSRIQVELAFHVPASPDGTLALCVTDNGCGFEPRTPHYWRMAKHHGIASMYETATLIGGSLEIESTLGMGTTVSLQVPPVALSDTGNYG